MSIEKIIAHAIQGNVLEMEESFKEEMRDRISIELEEKRKKIAKESEEDELEDDDDEDELEEYSNKK
jgi:hypothetical protein